MNNPLLNALNGAQAQPEVAPSIFPVAKPAKPQTPAQRQRMLNQTMQGPTVSPLQRAMMPNVAPVRRDTTPPALRVLPEYDFHRIAYGAENEQEKRDIMRREALTRRSNPNSLESVMASADKRLGTKQGDEVRELIKSFAWIRSGGINRGGLKAYVDEGIKRFEEQGIDSLRSFVETGRRYRDVDPTPRDGDDPELARAQYLKQSALQAQADLREGTPADVRQGVIDTGSSPQFGDAFTTGVYNTHPLGMIGQGIRNIQEMQAGKAPTVAMASEYGQNLAVDKPHMGEDPGLIALGVFNDFLAPPSRAYRQTMGPVSSANEGTQLGLQIGDFVGQIAVAAALPQTAAQGIAKLPEIGARFAAMDLPQYGEMVASSKGNAGKAATDFMEATFGQFAHADKLMDPKVPWSEKGHIALGMLQGSLLLAGALAGQPNRTAKAPLIQRIAKFLKLSGKDDSVVIAGQAKDAMETSMRFLGENADNPEVQAGIAQATNEPAPVDTSFRPSGRNVDPEQSFQKTIRVGSSGAEINSKAHPGVTTKVDLTPEENVWIAKTENLSPREIHEAWATPEGQAIAKKINDAESAADHAPAKVGDIVSGHNGASEVSGPVVEIFNGKYVVEDSVSGKQKVLEADQITSLERKAPAKPSPFSAEDADPFQKAPKGQKAKAPKEPPPDIQTPVAETKTREQIYKSADGKARDAINKALSSKRISDVLPELRSKIDTMDEAEALIYWQELGHESETIRKLRTGVNGTYEVARDLLDKRIQTLREGPIEQKSRESVAPISGKRNSGSQSEPLQGTRGIARGKTPDGASQGGIPGGLSDGRPKSSGAEMQDASRSTTPRASESSKVVERSKGIVPDGSKITNLQGVISIETPDKVTHRFSLSKDGQIEYKGSKRWFKTPGMRGAEETAATPPKWIQPFIEMGKDGSFGDSPVQGWRKFHPMGAKDWVSRPDARQFEERATKVYGKENVRVVDHPTNHLYRRVEVKLEPTPAPPAEKPLPSGGKAQEPKAAVEPSPVPPTKPVEAKAGAAKEPWQLGRIENRKNMQGYRMGDKAPSMVDQLAEFDAGHKAAVKQALSEGKPVPPEVLADYPDLKPTPKPPTPPKEPAATPEDSPVAVVREKTNDKTRTIPKAVSENGSGVDVGDSRQYYKRGIKGNLELATNATPYGAKTPAGLDLFTYRETVGEGKNRKSYTVIADARTGAEITRGAHLASADAGLKAIVDAKGVDAVLKRIDEYAAKHGESPSYQKPSPTPSKRTTQTKAELAKAFDDFKTETQKLGARRTPEQQAKELELTINLAKKAVAHGIATVEEFIQAAATHFGTTYTKAEQAVFRKAWEQVQPAKAEPKDLQGFAQADTAVVREAVGIEPYQKSKKSDATLIQNVKKRGLVNDAEYLAKKILAGHVPTDEEGLALGIRFAQTKNELALKSADVLGAEEGTPAHKAAVAALDEVDARLRLLADASDVSGSEQGRSFRARRMAIEAGMNIDPANIDEVLFELARSKGVKVSQIDQAHPEVVKLKARVAELEQLKADHEKAIADLQNAKAVSGAARMANRPRAARTVEQIRADRAAAAAEFKSELVKAMQPTAIGSGVGSLESIIQHAPKAAKALKKIIELYIEEYKVTKIDKAFYDGVRKTIDEYGLTHPETGDKLSLSDTEIRDVFAGMYDKTAVSPNKVKTDIQSLREQAKVLKRIEDVQENRATKKGKDTPVNDAEISKAQEWLSTLRDAEKDAKTVKRIQDTIDSLEDQKQGKWRNEPVKRNPLTHEDMRARVAELRKDLRLEDKVAALENQLQTRDFRGPDPKVQELTVSQLKLAAKIKRLSTEVRAQVKLNAPQTWADKISNYIGASVLSNPAARVLDVTANTVKLAAYLTMNPLRVPTHFALDRLLLNSGALGGGERIITIRKLRRSMDGYWESVKKDKRDIMGGTDADTAAKFGRGTLISKLTGLTDIPFKEFYSRLAIDDLALNEARRELGKKASKAEVEGRAKEIAADPTEEMMVVAHDWALRQTFNVDNFFGKMQQGVRATTESLGQKAFGETGKNIGRVVGILAETPLRFSKVIGNVALERVNYYPPAGLGEAVARTLIMAKSGYSPIQARLIADLTAKGLVGIALFYAGQYAVQNGMYKPQIVKTPNGTMFIDNGNTEQIGGPFGPFLAGANAAAIERASLTDKQRSKLKWDSNVGLLLDQPFFGGIKEIGRGDPRGMEKLAARTAFTLVPGSSAIREWAKTQDSLRKGKPYDRERRVKTKNFIEDIQKNVPFWRESLPDAGDTVIN